MKKILLFAFLLFAGGLFAQTPYDTVNVRDPQNFVEMTSVDTAYFQLIGRKANLNRRMSLTTLKNWILTGVDGIDTVYWSGDTLNILQGLTLWQAVADDNSGLFDADNNGDTVRISSALLKSNLVFSSGLYSVKSDNNSPLPALWGANAGSGAGVTASSVSGYAFDGAVGSSTTNTIVPALNLARNTTGTAASGLGVSISTSLEASNGLLYPAGYIGVKWTDATMATRTSAWEVYGVNSAATARKLAIAGSGQLTLDGYANNALNNVDSSLYVLAVDASGDVHTRAASGLGGDGSIYTADGTLTGDRFINSGGYFLINNGGFLAFADSAWYAAQGVIGEIPSDVTYWISNVGLTSPYQVFPGINAISSASEYSTATSYYDETFYAALVAKDGADSSQVIVGDADIRLYADTLDATGVTTFLGFPSGSDSQTLSTSNDTLTISGGNSVKLPITELLRDSVTTTTMTVDLETRYQKVVQIDMTSATNLTLTINNPTDAGVYTFHFLGVSGTDNVTWPVAFYDANNTALGTDALTAGTMYTCYYSSADAKYFCK